MQRIADVIVAMTAARCYVMQHVSEGSKSADGVKEPEGGPPKGGGPGSLAQLGEERSAGAQNPP